MLSHLEPILRLCDRHFFARFCIVGKAIQQLTLGPPGELLRKNIHQEWNLNSLISNERIFPYYSSSAITGNIGELIEPFSHARLCTTGNLPLGIAVETSDVWVSDVETSRLVSNCNQTILKIYMFLDPLKSTQFFDEWQQSQKSWWGKISAYPERFSLSGVKNEKNDNIVEILAEFAWGKQPVERISLNNGAIFDSLNLVSKQEFQTKSGRKKELPHVLSSTMSLENAVLTFLCDAYSHYTNSRQSREIMRFHRKMAPYKTSFSISSSSTSNSSELYELAEFLAKQLRSKGISTLLLADACKMSLESQFVKNDELGIPYTVVMNDSTLTNGIISLRSRDTTLKEQVHITELKKYMCQLYENY